ncbi:YfiR family protein [Noviherbaspirillum saxi]|nr:YfiR family protein [Noviherbaspirillum saxi]
MLKYFFGAMPPPRPTTKRERRYGLLARVLVLGPALVLALALWSLPLPSAGQASSGNSTASATEERVKAAFLFKFPNYVEWPAAAFAQTDSPYVIGVIGEEAILEELRRISAGRSINNRAVTIKKLQPGESLTGIHVLFIGANDRGRQAQVLTQANMLPILLVTETEGALAQGSMINFRIADDRVRFEASLVAAEKAGLKLSSRLLAIAISVVKGSQK